MQEVLEEGGDEEEEAAEEVVCCSTNAICQYSQHLIQGGDGGGRTSQLPRLRRRRVTPLGRRREGRGR